MEDWILGYKSQLAFFERMKKEDHGSPGTPILSAEEWQARVDLAACYRLVDKYGMTDLIYNHITARIPGSADHLLINLYGMLYKEITASSLVKIDVEGNIVWKPDTDYGINKSGYVIHGAIHKARPGVACVLHTHTRAGIACNYHRRSKIEQKRDILPQIYFFYFCFFFCWLLMFKKVFKTHKLLLKK